MDLLVARRLLVQPPAHLCHERVQLAVQLAPFAQPKIRQETLVALAHQQAVRLLVPERFLEPFPDFQIRQKIGTLVEKFRMCLRHRFLLVHRPFARILHRQRRGDDQHFIQAALLFCCDQHAPHPRIDRQLRQLAADRRELASLVHRAELGQQLIAVGDHSRGRRIDERKVLDLAEFERAHAQDHRGERGAQDFGVAEFGAGLEILLAVEAHADAVHHPPATARALVGRSLRDLLDLQQLHFVAVTIAIDPGKARVDHEADAGNSERGLRHVGGKHDAAGAAPGREDALLLLCGQPREQRQDLRALRMMLAQGLGNFADFPFPRQEHQHVAG